MEFEVKSHPLMQGKDGERVVFLNGKPLEIHHQYCSHSYGFSWGYAGSGPAQLAFEILFEWFKLIESMPENKSAELAYKYHQEFKMLFIMPVPQNDYFRLTGEDIKVWVQNLSLDKEIDQNG